MCPIPYYTMKRQSKDPQYLRFELARRAKEQGIKPTAKQFGTTPKTVRKWLKRWIPGTLQGLQDQAEPPYTPSPPHPPSATPEGPGFKTPTPLLGGRNESNGTMTSPSVKKRSARFGTKKPC